MPKRQPGPEGHRTVYQAIRGNRRSLELTALIIVLFLINLLWNSHTAQQVQDHEDAIVAKACDFWYPLTNLPVTVIPPSRKASQVSVHIISGARESYAGQCSDHGLPPLPPPDPSFTRWARFYHVPVTP